MSCPGDVGQAGLHALQCASLLACSNFNELKSAILRSSAAGAAQADVTGGLQWVESLVDVLQRILEAARGEEEGMGESGGEPAAAASPDAPSRRRPRTSATSGGADTCHHTLTVGGGNHVNNLKMSFITVLVGSVYGGRNCPCHSVIPRFNGYMDSVAQAGRPWLLPCRWWVRRRRGDGEEAGAMRYDPCLPCTHIHEGKLELLSSLNST